MITYFYNVYKISKALLEGMALTLTWMFKPNQTVQYPHQKLVQPERFRGTLTFDKDTCTACNLCVKACPTACISLEPAIDPATQKRVAKVSWYQIDFGKCNYCRLCEEACPTKPIKSVRHTHNYEWAIVNRKDMFARWIRDVAAAPVTSGSPLTPPSDKGKAA